MDNVTGDGNQWSSIKKCPPTVMGLCPKIVHSKINVNLLLYDPVNSQNFLACGATRRGSSLFKVSFFVVVLSRILRPLLCAAGEKKCNVQQVYKGFTPSFNAQAVIFFSVCAYKEFWNL